MSRCFFVFCLLVTSIVTVDNGHVGAQKAAAQTVKTTKEGYPAAVTREDLQLAIDIMAAGDRVALQLLLDTNKNVIILAGGIEVVVVESTWGGLAKIRPVGAVVTMWTVMRAIQ